MRKPFLSAALLVLLVFPAVLAYPYNDGFGDAKKLTTKHFSVYYAPELDPDQLCRQLDVTAQETLASGEPSNRSNSLAGALDALFGWASKALDMNLYDLKGDIKICRDSKHLGEVYRNIFNAELGAESFYVTEFNTIYLCPGSMKKEIVAHEISHMIITHYFVVAPPAKVQEILCGYVEYEMRKMSRSLK